MRNLALVSTILLVLLTACVSTGVEKFRFYSGEQRSLSEVAVLKSVEGKRGVIIRSINMIPGPNGGKYNDLGSFDYWIELPPDTYVVRIDYKRSTGTGVEFTTEPILRKFEAKAGHVYTIDYETDRHFFSKDAIALTVKDITNP